MPRIATARWLAALLLLPFMGAQAQPLNDDFIFFVDGANLQIPETAFDVVDDPQPDGASDKAAEFTYGNFTPLSFGGFDRATGTDATTYTGDEYGDSDYKLYVDILSGTDNAGKTISLTFFDSTDDPAVTREGLEAGTEEGNLEFRLVWTIPQEAHDDAAGWFSYAIPLPPSTIAALDSAKVGKDSDGNDLGVTVDPLLANWSYTGGWNNGGGFGFGEPGGFVPASTDPLFEEFNWGELHSMAVFFDTDQGGETIWLDNVYIADEVLDLSSASNTPDAMGATVAASASGEANVVSWTHNEAFGGYNVYASLDPITDVNAEGVLQIGNVLATAEAFEVVHNYELPHPSLSENTFYYAVTSLSEFGVENDDVALSTANVMNPNIEQQPVIIQLTADEADTIFDNIDNGVVSSEGFPDGYAPFVIGGEHSRVTEGTPVDFGGDSDQSGSFWMAYSNADGFRDLYIYAEITDDQATFIGSETENPGATTWNFDSYEIGWGDYDVRDVPGGTILTGSPFQGMERGTYPNYQFRVAAVQNASGDITGTTTYGGAQNATPDGFEITGSGTVAEKTDTGWRALTLIPLDQIQYDGDALPALPSIDEFRLMPMELALNDADGETRQHQITWGLKANHTNQWWNTPAQWPTVAMAGRNTALPVDNEEGSQARAFALGANYPNPFARSTKIAYTLDRDADVTLEVYDVLGRRVAQLVDQAQPAGPHAVEFNASGLANGAYLYRLRAGDKVAVRRMMVIN